jgi:hypothetical protein
VIFDLSPNGGRNRTRTEDREERWAAKPQPQGTSIQEGSKGGSCRNAVPGNGVRWKFAHKVA